MFHFSKLLFSDPDLILKKNATSYISNYILNYFFMVMQVTLHKKRAFQRLDHCKCSVNVSYSYFQRKQKPKTSPWWYAYIKIIRISPVVHIPSETQQGIFMGTYSIKGEALSGSISFNFSPGQLWTLRPSQAPSLLCCFSFLQPFFHCTEKEIL